MQTVIARDVVDRWKHDMETYIINHILCAGIAQVLAGSEGMPVGVAERQASGTASADSRMQMASVELSRMAAASAAFGSVVTGSPFSAEEPQSRVAEEARRQGKQAPTSPRGTSRSSHRLMAFESSRMSVGTLSSEA